MISIDSRIGSKELAPYITPPHEITTLEFGDVEFVGMGDNAPAFVCIERKVITDLIQSMREGRLSGHQLIGMLEQYTHIYLLVEGIWRGNSETGLLEIWKGRGWQPFSYGDKLMARDIYNYVNTLAVICGVIPVFTGSIQESGQWISATFNWWQKDFGDHKSHLKFHRNETQTKQQKRVMLRRPNAFEKIVSGISNVSFSTASKLNKRFSNVMELSLASEEELMEVKGVGKKLAQTIIKELRDGLS